MLKAVVIVLGVLVVLGVGVIVAEIVRRVGDAAGPSSPELATAAVPLPPGARAIGMTGEGDALSLLVEDGDGGQWVITVDRRSGAVLGTLTLMPGR